MHHSIWKVQWWIVHLPETCRKPARNLPKTKKKVFGRFPAGFRQASGRFPEIHHWRTTRYTVLHKYRHNNFLTGNHGNHGGEIKSGTNDGVVCIDSTFMITMVSSPKGGMPILMQIVYLWLTYFKRADSFETNDTKIFLNT